LSKLCVTGNSVIAILTGRSLDSITGSYTEDWREYTRARDNILTVQFSPVGEPSNEERFFINVIAGKDSGM
jgi:hypothetical protein